MPDGELITLLDDSDAMKSLEAAKCLQLRGGSKVIKLAQHYCKHTNYRRRSLGAFILGRIKLSPVLATNTIDILHHLALRDKSAIVRSNSLSSLGHRCKINNSFATLLLKLSEKTVFDSSANVRQSTAFALSNFYDETSIALLLKLLNDSNSHVRDWAAFAVNMNGY